MIFATEHYYCVRHILKTMGSSASIPRDKRVVVVGGGYGGIQLCRQLQKAGATFTLIDPKSYFYHNVACVRAVVDTSKIMHN